MKISANHSISVNTSAVRELGSLLKNINPGDTVSASLIRSDGSKAQLEIGGKIITAEFTNGVPHNRNIELVLTSKTSEKIQFALKDNQLPDKIVTFLSPFSILQDDDVKKNSLQNLARFINTAKPDLMDINLFLLGFKKDGQREKTGHSLFNRLLQKGVPFQTLIDLSYIVYSKYNPVLFLSYQYMMALAGRKPFDKGSKDAESIEEEIDNLCRTLKEDDLDFSVMLKMIFDDDKYSEIYGDMAYPDDDSFTGIEYVSKGDAFFLKFEFSAAGTLAVFIKSHKEQLLINFLSEKEEVLSFMKESESVLKKMLDDAGVKKSIIGYFDSKKIVDKLELWSLDFYTKSGFNVKV